MTLEERVKEYAQRPERVYAPPVPFPQELREIVAREARKRASEALSAWVDYPSVETRREFIRAMRVLETAERSRRRGEAQS